MILTFMVDVDIGSLTTEEADRAALLSEMFQREGANLVRLARIFSDDRNAAEDLVQEAFIRLYRSAHKIRDPEKLPAYLRSIVLNLARDHNRRGLLSLRHQDAEPARTPAQPDDQITRNEEQEKVLSALGELSPRQRDCLVLRYFFELAEREIAATLEISPNSVKTHTRRGLAALESILEDNR